MSSIQDNRIFPPFPPGGELKMPFFYASTAFFWTFYQANADKLDKYLEGTGLKAVRFADMDPNTGLVSMNFQNYTAHLGNGLSTVNEVEFNIHCFPKSQEKYVPSITFDDYMYGQEQTKLIGGFRLHVPADNQFAVKAGIEVFGERKFLTTFQYEVPAPNKPENTTWDYQVNDPNIGPAGPGEAFIYKVTADLHGPEPTLGNASPITLYSMLPGGPDSPPGNGRLIGSRWNLLGMYQNYMDLSLAKLTLQFGSSEHPMRKDMEDIIGDTPCCAVRYFHSQPSAVENRAYWVEPEGTE